MFDALEPLCVVDGGVVGFGAIEAEIVAAVIFRDAECAGFLLGHDVEGQGDAGGADDGGCATEGVWIAGGGCAFAAVMKETDRAAV